jgi:transposase
MHTFQIGNEAGVDAGDAPGVPTESAAQVRELKRKNAKLQKTIEILKAPTSFLHAGRDPPRR